MKKSEGRPQRGLIRGAMGAGVTALGLLLSSTIAGAGDAPNFLVIVADDVGFSDLGVMGSEIATPHLDALAGQGTVLTDFYVSPFCSPTRAMLMTGADNHQVGFGAMTELIPPQLRETPGYEGYLNERAAPFPQFLQDAGYNTYLTGKWHLGTIPEASPDKMGFDRSYALMQGGAGHFDQTGIIATDPDKPPKALYRENGAEVDLPADFYSSSFFVDKMIDYIEEDRASGQPFFSYLAFTAPHWPLQARQDDIARYEGVYDAGYDAIRDSRMKAMIDLGYFPQGTDAFAGNEAWPRWDSLDAGQQQAEARRMAVYAAMVEAMDREIGRMVDYLDRTDQLDNTYILFFSDNGADGNTPSDVASTREWIKRSFDNSVANTGNVDSYVDYGPGWAQVGSTPLRLYKAFLHEGGIRVPAISVLPAALRPDMAQPRSAAVAHVMDVAPTILDMAGVDAPGDTYRGRPVAGLMGASMLPHLRGEAVQVHADDHVIGWELQGRKALRKGDWKIVYANAPWGRDEWELYNIKADPTESDDLAEAHPDKLAELAADYEAWAARTGTVDLTELGRTVGYSNGLSYYDDLSESAASKN